MELISIIDNFAPYNDKKLILKAEALKPALHRETILPVRVFRLAGRYCTECEELDLKKLSSYELKKGDNLCLDMGTHCVGSLTLSLGYAGCHPDAPAFLKLKFAEQFCELGRDSSSYDGWISRGWLQEEFLHADELPGTIGSGRRYAFRYLKITVLDTSRKYRLTVTGCSCETVTSADPANVRHLKTGDAGLDRIYETGLKTLVNCMQDVYEDGPKRDRRLWTGDLRLQAVAGYAAAPQYDLVKRCLYLFAGSRFPDGRVSAGIFTSPAVEADDTFFFDYSLFFVAALEEYLAETDDQEALRDLYPVAVQQIDLALRELDESGVVSKKAAKESFIDWCDDLDRQAAAHAILIYAIRYAAALAERMEDTERIHLFHEWQTKLRTAAEGFWDATKECYLSNGQRAAATQVWMVLAEVPDPQRAKKLMSQVQLWTDGPKMNTPYMHHYYMVSLINTGFLDAAKEHMLKYWGSMVDAGADTFYEVWDPENPDSSPYGGPEVVSCCHAWSCTPVWFIYKYFS